MRNLKKVLSLALALVMLLGMMVVGAGAAVTTTKDYADGASVNYTEAVDVMSAIGVFSGTGNNQFTPNGNLTRAQAAKIITYMLLGKEAAEKLGTLTAPFADVPASNWAAGSIAYCSNMGIVSGIGNNKFNPDGLVTGYEFAKMLLVALGYDAEREVMTGKDWSINVARLTLTAALDTGLDKGTDIPLDKVLTREEACQMAFNTINATMVEYANNASTITVGGIPIVIGGSNATKVISNRGYAQNIDDADVTSDGYSALQFGERYFQTLVRDNTGVNDDMGRPAHSWQYGRDDVGTYADTPVFTYTASCTGDPNKTALERELRGYTFSSEVPVVNGKTNPGITVIAAVDAAGAAPDTVDSLAELTGNGVVVEVYADLNRDITKIVVINTYLMQVTRTSATEVSLGVVNGLGNPVAAVKDESPCFATLSGLKVDDYVLITPVTKDNTNYTVAAAAVPESVTGALTRVEKNNPDNSTSSVTLGGSSYGIAARKTIIANGQDIDALTHGNLTAQTKRDAILLLDTYGYVVAVQDVATVTNYMYIIGSYQTLVDNHIVTMAQGVSVDGTVVDVNVGSPSNSNPNTAKVATGGLVEYHAASDANVSAWDSVYDLTAVDTTVLPAGGYRIQTQATTVGTVLSSIPYAGNVNFIYINDGKVTVRSGAQNVTLSGSDYAQALVVKNSNGVNVVTAVFVPSDPVDVGADVLFMHDYQGPITIDGATQSVYQAYIDGEKKTINVKTTANNLKGTFYSYSYNEALDLYTVSTYGTKASVAVATKVSDTLSSVVDYRLITTAGGLNNLNAANAQVINLTNTPNLATMRDLQNLVNAGNVVTVSVLYNDQSTSPDKGIVKYIWVTGVAASTNAALTNGTIAISGGNSAPFTISSGPDTITLMDADNAAMDISNADGTLKTGVSISTLPAGATVKVTDTNDDEKTGNLIAGDKIVITAKDGTTTKTYVVAIARGNVALTNSSITVTNVDFAVAPVTGKPGEYTLTLDGTAKAACTINNANGVLTSAVTLPASATGLVYSTYTVAGATTNVLNDAGALVAGDKLVVTAENGVVFVYTVAITA